MARQSLSVTTTPADPGPTETKVPEPGSPAKAKRPRRLSESRMATLRQAVPILGVVVVVVLVAAIAYFVYASNRRGAVTLGNDLVTATDRRVGAQMRSYFLPAQQFLTLADVAAGGRGVWEAAPEMERFARYVLGSGGSITGYLYADTQGNTLYVVRNDKGGFDTNMVDRRDGPARSTLTRRDAEDKTIAVEDNPKTTYDPRTRPWYKGAEKARAIYWSGAYWFAEQKKPGLTVSIPHFDGEGKLQSVMALDIELSTFDTFLDQLNIGAHGRAMVLDGDGRLIAYPDDNWLPAKDPDAKAPKLDDLDEPVLSYAYSVLRVEGSGRRILTIGEDRYIFSAEPARRLAGLDWIVLIVVPETDFVGFVADSGMTALLMSIAVVLVVAGLTSFLAWRSVKAERRAFAATQRQEALEVRSTSFIELARDSVAVDAEEAGLARATESAAVACNAMRVAVWRLSRDGRTLSCEDCFDRDVADHTSGLALHDDEMPNLFAALAKGEAIDTSDAGHDRRTSELFASYLEPLEITSVYLSPIVMSGRLMGMLSVEDPGRGESAAGLGPFCDALSVLLALRFAAAAAPAPTAPRAELVAANVAAAVAAKASAMPASAPPAAPPPARTEGDSIVARRARLERTLLTQNTSLAKLGESALDGAAIGVIKLPNWTTVTQKPADCDDLTAMDSIVHELRCAIEKSDVSYAALLDDQIVLASFSPGGATLAEDAACVAAAMLDLRDQLIELEDRWVTTLDFRLAIDVGPVMSSTVATVPPSRNLWGGSVGIAKVLASTTARRTIAVSEAAYDLLSTRFLFRSRGTYFLPETGTMRTFVMVGRL